MKNATFRGTDLQWNYLDSEQGAPGPAEDGEAVERPLEAHGRNCEQ